MRHHCEWRGKCHLNLGADHRSNHRRQALVGYVYEFRTCTLIDQLTEQMLAVAHAAGAVVYLRATVFRQIEQLFIRLRRHLRMYHHVVTAHFHHLRHRREIAYHVKRRLLVHQLIVGERVRSVDHGVTVRRRLGHDLTGNNAVGAAAVVDDELLAHLARQRVAQRAHHGIHGAADGLGDDHADGAGGVRLRLRRLTGKQ